MNKNIWSLIRTLNSSTSPSPLKASSYGSAYQIFINLSVEHDIITMMAHLDFLGLIDGTNPTLDEVDEVFSSILVFNVHLSRYTQEDQTDNIQSMAAWFTIAMMKEEYDFSDDAVMEKIYLSVLFILNVYSMFDPRFRDATYRVAEHYFGLCKSSSLKYLKKLRMRIDQDLNATISATSGDVAGVTRE